jgi:hypothetical protein
MLIPTTQKEQAGGWRPYLKNKIKMKRLGT